MRNTLPVSSCVPLDRSTKYLLALQDGRPHVVATSYCMQLVRTAQSKHKINLLALSTEDGGPYVVATWYVVLIVCSSCVPPNSNTNTSSHSPRRTGGLQASASGVLVITTLTTVSSVLLCLVALHGDLIPCRGLVFTAYETVYYYYYYV